MAPWHQKKRQREKKKHLRGFYYQRCLEKHYEEYSYFKHEFLLSICNFFKYVSRIVGVLKMSKSRKSRVQKEKVKHRTGLIKHFTNTLTPSATKLRKQRENEAHYRDELRSLARRAGMPDPFGD